MVFSLFLGLGIMAAPQAMAAIGTLSVTGGMSGNSTNAANTLIFPGTVQVGASSPVTVTVAVAGGTALIEAIRLDSPNFRIENNACAASTGTRSLDSTGTASCTFNVVFAPTTAGWHYGELIIYSDAIVSNTFPLVYLQGNATAPSVPGAPASVVAAAGNASATVTITAPASNGGSAITFCTVTGGGTDSNSASGVGVHTITGLTNGTSYTFTATCSNALGAGPVATAAPVTPVASAPGAPTSVSAAAGVLSATVTITAPTSNGGSSITGYTVTPNPAGGTDSNPGAGLVHTITGLTQQSYNFTVTATNGVGTGSGTTSNSVTPVAAATAPDAPASVVAVAGGASATVSFTAPASDGGSAITRYNVTGGGTDSTPGNGLVHTIINLTNGVPYTFAVTATNPIGTGPAATAAPVTPVASAPGAPSSVAAVAGNASATVTIIAPASNGGSAITGYNVTGGGTDSTPGAGLVHTITGLTNDTPYTFTVTATNVTGTGPGAVSNSVTPTANSLPAGCTIKPLTWGAGYNSTTPKQSMGNGQDYAFSKTFAAGAMGQAGTVYASHPKLMSISETPCDFTNPPVINNCIAAATTNDPVLNYTTDVTKTGKCVITAGRTYYINVRNRQFPASPDSCPVGSTCTYYLKW